MEIPFGRGALPGEAGWVKPPVIVGATQHQGSKETSNAEARALAGPFFAGGPGKHVESLLTRLADALEATAEHDKQVAADALRDAAQQYPDHDVRWWLNQRADSIAKAIIPGEQVIT